MYMAHIPKCGTAELLIPDFRVALSQSLLPQEDYDSEKWLYVPCRYDEFRYILGTKGKKPLICIGINPSTARPDAFQRIRLVSHVQFVCPAGNRSELYGANLQFSFAPAEHGGVYLHSGKCGQTACYLGRMGNNH